ncbi:hypothetical protein [Nocardiopsis rhodophaea]|uniref:hypothetical protein n=1 Tax=Nocardiopsis rhodophaea TaxID=280238 RepID=UPI0031D9C99D
MERHESADDARQPLTTAEAEAALRGAEQARASINDIRTPLWYSLALAVWIAPVGPLISLLPDPPLGMALLLGGMVVWGAGFGGLLRLVMSQMRVLAWLTPRQMLPMAVVMLPLLGAYVALLRVFDLSWGTYPLTVVVGVGVIVFGIYDRFRGGAVA